MVKVAFKPSILELNITGHAGAGEKGEDLVCCAVSTLFYTLGKVVSDSRYMMKCDSEITDENGNGHIKCNPTPKYKPTVQMMYYVALEGFKLLADSYPNFIEVE